MSFWSQRGNPRRVEYTLVYLCFQQGIWTRLVRGMHGRAAERPGRTGAPSPAAAAYLPRVARTNPRAAVKFLQQIQKKPTGPSSQWWWWWSFHAAQIQISNPTKRVAAGRASGPRLVGFVLRAGCLVWVPRACLAVAAGRAPQTNPTKRGPEARLAPTWKSDE